MSAEYKTVASVSEVPPGERIVVEIGRRWIAIFNVDGQYYAIEDRCTHDDGPLAEGDLHECIIECPRHGASFDIRTGKVLSAPALIDVPAFVVRVTDGEIQIGPRKQ